MENKNETENKNQDKDEIVIAIDNKILCELCGAEMVNEQYLCHFRCPVCGYEMDLCDV